MGFWGRILERNAEGDGCRMDVDVDEVFLSSRSAHREFPSQMNATCLGSFVCLNDEDDEDDVMLLSSSKVSIGVCPFFLIYWFCCLSFGEDE